MLAYEKILSGILKNYNRDELKKILSYNSLQKTINTNSETKPNKEVNPMSNNIIDKNFRNEIKIDKPLIIDNYSSYKSHQENNKFFQKETQKIDFSQKSNKKKYLVIPVKPIFEQKYKYQDGLRNLIKEHRMEITKKGMVYNLTYNKLNYSNYKLNSIQKSKEDKFKRTLREKPIIQGIFVEKIKYNSPRLNTNPKDINVKTINEENKSKRLKIQNLNNNNNNNKNRREEFDKILEELKLLFKSRTRPKQNKKLSFPLIKTEPNIKINQSVKENINDSKRSFRNNNLKLNFDDNGINYALKSDTRKKDENKKINSEINNNKSNEIHHNLMNNSKENNKQKEKDYSKKKLLSNKKIYLLNDNHKSNNKIKKKKKIIEKYKPKRYKNNNDDILEFIQK